MKNIPRDRWGVYLDQLSSGEVAILWAENEITGHTDLEGVRKWVDLLNQYLLNIEGLGAAVAADSVAPIVLVELETVLNVATRYAMDSVGRVAQKVGSSL